MKEINIESELVYTVIAKTSFVFNIAAAKTAHQEITNEQLIITPNLPAEWFDTNDEGARGIRLIAEPVDLTDELKVQYRATTRITPEVNNTSELHEVEHRALPAVVLPFLNPSRYCESDQLARFSWQKFGQSPAGYQRVESVCDWVHQNIAYVSGSTNASSSARDVFTQRAGVCRDFAHLCITICRALGIPARYVSGYAAGLQPPDFHGFFEAYLGEHWYMFDATKMAPVEGFVRIGVGRDAADTSFAILVGQANLQSMRITATSDSFNEEQGKTDNTAISTA